MDSLPQLVRPTGGTAGASGPGGDAVLVASRCAACGHVAFPALETCPGCCGSEPGEITLGPTGTLRLFTVVRHPVPGSAVAAPYGVGLVEFPPGIRVLGVLTTSDIDGLAPGQPVTVVVAPAAASGEDAGGGGYRFRP